jgi:hypothetical protein
MKKLLIILFLMFVGFTTKAQSESDIQAIKKACNNYLDGFYNGDTLKLKESLKPTLYKYGYWKSKEGVFEGSQMTFEKAVNYSKNVLEKKQFAKADAPRKIEVLDVLSHIAAVKVTAWWGKDYILLSKKDDNWIIEQVLWEGPLEN